MTFALITEGVSEHRIIKHIITKYFKDEAIEPEINQIQPKVIDNKQATVGSWNEVLKYCERTEDLKAIFVENDYLIIQIDTDQCQQKPFEISHSKADNKPKSVDELCVDIIEKLKGLIDPEVFEVHGNKIFFAICVHTIECWLLPIFPGNHKAATTSCIDKLNKEIKKRNIAPLPTKNKNSFTSIRTYDTILKNWKKKQDIINSAQHNAGFNNFIEALNVIKPIIE